MVNTRAHIVIVTPNPGIRLSWKEGTQMVSHRVELRIHLGASALPDCSPFSSAHRSSTSGASFLIIIADMHPSSESITHLAPYAHCFTIFELTSFLFQRLTISGAGIGSPKPIPGLTMHIVRSSIREVIGTLAYARLLQRHSPCIFIARICRRCKIGVS
jgi:hypothetical protein